LPEREVAELFRPYVSEEMRACYVSTVVESVKNDRPECVAAPA
jgi:putative SOS response-associated peptidase YedK